MEDELRPSEISFKEAIETKKFYDHIFMGVKISNIIGGLILLFVGYGCTFFAKNYKPEAVQNEVIQNQAEVVKHNAEEARENSVRDVSVGNLQTNYTNLSKNLDDFKEVTGAGFDKINNRLDQMILNLQRNNFNSNNLAK